MYLYIGREFRKNVTHSDFNVINFARSFDVDSDRQYLITLRLHRTCSVNLCMTSEIGVDSGAKTLDPSKSILVRSSEISRVRESNREVKASMLDLR